MSSFTTLTLGLSLEINIHQLVLSDLAANIGKSKDDTPEAELLPAIELVTSQVETRCEVEEEEQPSRVFMVRLAQLSPTRSY